MTTRVRHGRSLSLRLSFVVATVSFVLVFAAAGTPIPLYNLYRAQDGITHSDLAMVSVAYFVAAATALLLLGRLSDYFGRKPLAIAALASAAASCLILAGMRGVESLFVARVLQGLASGLAPSGLGAYAVDSAPPRPRWLPSVITGSSPMLGIPLGALACGALAQFAPAPRVLVYAITGALLVACTVMMGLARETMHPRPGAWASLRPRLLIPQGSGRLLVVAGAACVATWSLGGFYQAFGPSAAAEYLGTTSPLVAATMFASVMVLNPLGGALAGRLPPIIALRAGLGLFALALVGILVSLHAGLFVALIVASLLAGLSQGAASTGAIQGLLPQTAPDQRAGLLSTLYLISYCGAALPGMVASHYARSTDLFSIALGYAALGLLASIVAIIASPRNR